nr:hypothetical protein Iba_chr15dCG7120 [Ipomoea batatas]
MLLCHNAGRFPEEITAELHLVVATSRRKVKAGEENAAAVDHRCCCCEQGTPSLSVELAEGPARFRRRRRREEMELLAGVLRYRLLRAAWSWRKEDAAVAAGHAGGQGKRLRRRSASHIFLTQREVAPFMPPIAIACHHLPSTEESSLPALILRLWHWSSRREDSTATVAWFAGVVKRGIGTRLHSTKLPLPSQSSATAAICVRRRGNLRCRAPPLSTVAPTRRRKSRRFYPPPCTAKKQGRRQLPLEWDVRELPSPSRTAAMLLCHNAGRFPEEITAELHLVVATSRRKVKAGEENAAAVDHRCCCCEQGTPSLSVELAEGPARLVVEERGRCRRRWSRRRTGEEASTSFCFTYVLDAKGGSPVHAADRHCLPSPSIVTVASRQFWP